MSVTRPLASLCSALVLIALGPALVISARGSQATQAAPDPAARAWTGRTAEIEDYLRTARIVRTEGTDRGVTKPGAGLLRTGRPGRIDDLEGPPPGFSHGYYESYKSEIAAYEIDKLLALGMVPPKVEREVDGEVGVAVMWVDGTRSFADMGGVPTPPPAKIATWNRQIIRAKMFHNLIGDIDPNLGNWLIDPEWRVMLIDQSRSLTTTTRLVHEMQQVDGPLWARMRALTADGLTRDLSRWLGSREIKAILARRDRMQAKIDRLPPIERRGNKP